MQLGKKKETKTIELLQKKNILIHCRTESKSEVIKRVGTMLAESGYVRPDYVNAMLEREKTFPTYMGNGIALPHGTENGKNDILYSGIAIMLFPDGIDWDGEIAKVVIGIAGKGMEHLDILGNIATRLGEEEAVKNLLDMTEEQVFDFITGKEEGE